jgi:hypothetical protein
MDAPINGMPRTVESGALNLLLKAAAHPSVNVCSLALPVLSKIVVTMPSLAPELLPMLQRRAIIPQQFQNGSISFASVEACGVSAVEFQSFRYDVLAEALVGCWKGDHLLYMESCRTAVEEFCCERSSVDASLQLEAALFCIEIVYEASIGLYGPKAYENVLTRTLAALSVKPPSLMLNAVTRSRACSMLKKVSRSMEHPIP